METRGVILARHITKFVAGYFINLFLSWSVFIALFFTILPAVIIPSFILSLVKKIQPDLISILTSGPVYLLLVQKIASVLKSWPYWIKQITSFFLAALPFLTFILQKFNVQINEFGTFFKKYFFKAAFINIGCLALVVFFNPGQFGEKIYTITVLSIVFVVAGLFGKLFYIFSKSLKNFFGAGKQRILK